MFCVERPVANARKHRIETVMWNRAREDGTGMHDSINDSGVGSKGRGDDGRAGRSKKIGGVVGWLFVT